MMDFANIDDARKLAQAIVNTIHDPLLVLDGNFFVLAASRSFYHTFKADPELTRGRLLFSLGDGQWDIPALRLLLETIIPTHAAMDGLEVEHDFPLIGRRTMLLNARQVIYDNEMSATILLAFTDVTARRTTQRDRDKLLERSEELLRQKEILLQEMQHRVANSLQIIASILLLKARIVTSEETRRDLQDAHQRLMSVAEVQRHLHVTHGIDQIDVGPYLSKLCASLCTSMTGSAQPIEISVICEDARISSDHAVSLGLIVTELTINAIKYAFPNFKADANVLISYEVDENDWKLVVSDNGIGKNEGPVAEAGGGLGTAIIQALVKQLGAQIELTSNRAGTIISITRATFVSRVPKAA
ncbi:sensor histidine kinase [Rhizobium tubonense]|uniref:histidine kinase n=1 Tax=Rhizobium tubonense TaxID=484088 RepID=A0A2W4EL61_9HYPH|nr:PAS domain-containing sensor histidine kinase [Rhizobium tubonense]PZM11570.1 histidine kinase [Rhizobium tubonense]